MSPRIGRPKIDNPKAERITVRLDAESSDTLKEYCVAHNIEKAEAVRRGIKKLRSELKK